METIIASCVTAGVTLVICLITNHAQSQKTIALMEYRLNELTSEVRKHNGFIERTYKLEQDSALHEAELKRIGHRLSALEEKGGHHA